MHSIPFCDTVAIERRGVLGVGRAPAFLGPGAKVLARATAMAQAAGRFEAVVPTLASHLEREYECLDETCDLTAAQAEPQEVFSWRELYEGRSGDQYVAIWLLEIEFFIGCVPAVGLPPGEDPSGLAAEAEAEEEGEVVDALADTTSWSLREMFGCSDA